MILAVFLLGISFAGGVILCGRHLSARRLPALRFLDGRFDQMIIYAHMLDASSTFIGVDWFDYCEKHVVPSCFINLVGTEAIMYPLKLLFILPVLYMVDGSMQKTSQRNLTRLSMAI